MRGTEEQRSKKKTGGFLAFIGNFFIVIMSGLLFGMLSLLLAGYVIPHRYDSQTLFILQKENGEGLLQGSVAELIDSDAFLNQLITDTHVTLNGDQLRKRISVTEGEARDSYLIQVTANDPYVARAMVIAIRTEMLSMGEKSQGALSLRIIKEAEVPMTMSFPDYRIFGIAGILAGLILSILILALAGPSENVIISAEDIEDYLEMKCLGEIPVSGVLGKKNRRGGNER